MARVHGAEMKRRSSHELSGLVASSDNVCSHCGAGKLPNDDLRPYGHIICETAIAWLHSGCWPAWIGARQAEAIAGLAAKGTRTYSCLLDEILQAEMLADEGQANRFQRLLEQVGGDRE
jgi:hypothetical protein